MTALPPQAITALTLQEKYCTAGETTVAQVRRRVAHAIAAVEAEPGRWETHFYDALAAGMIMGGRINAAAGTARESTWINCFVQPVADSISQRDADGNPGIYLALQQATETMRLGGGVGYDFSRLRPRGAYVRSTQSEASGPVSYMRVFDRSCETVESAGARRGAQMAVLRIDHPDVLEFVLRLFRKAEVQLLDRHFPRRPEDFYISRLVLLSYLLSTKTKGILLYF
jgi:ribonucleoside-diphosphate reductase alpha chain